MTSVHMKMLSGRASWQPIYSSKAPAKLPMRMNNKTVDALWISNKKIVVEGKMELIDLVFDAMCWLMCSCSAGVRRRRWSDKPTCHRYAAARQKSNTPPGAPEKQP